VQGNRTREPVWHEILDFLKSIKKMPTWAILILVLFGSGGVFYKACDYLRRQHEAEGGKPLAGYAEATASFFPPISTRTAGGLYVRVQNASPQASLPNLRIVLDADEAKIQSCEVSTSAKLTAPPAGDSDSLFVTAVDRLSPLEAVAIYCLAQDAHHVKVSWSSADAAGRILAASTKTFTKSDVKADGGDFAAFLWVLLGAVLVVATICLIVFLIAGAAKLYKFLRL
jgi:hypothetical protein